MNKLSLLLPAAFFGAFAPLCAQNAPATDPLAPPPAKPKAAKPAPVKLPPQPPDVAAPKLGPDGKPQGPFLKLHEAYVKIAKEGKTDLLFLGDSITFGWNANKPIWEKAFGAYNPANFGIGGDRTQHVLWRIENGELDGIKPKAVVLMIGTNNSASDKPEDTAAGVTKIVKTIQAKVPSAKILLLAIFPRGDKPNPLRAKNEAVNKIIAKLADGRNVFFMDIGDKFLEPDGVTLTRETMPDLLHLSPKAYQAWADAISPKLAELMR